MNNIALLSSYQCWMEKRDGVAPAQSTPTAFVALEKKKQIKQKEFPLIMFVIPPSNVFL